MCEFYVTNDKPYTYNTDTFHIQLFRVLLLMAFDFDKISAIYGFQALIQTTFALNSIEMLCMHQQKHFIIPSIYIEIEAHDRMRDSVRLQ